jgi:cyclophilin family peptidyl-prolyl cis-trans isomerase/HEAT repeat protein
VLLVAQAGQILRPPPNAQKRPPTQQEFAQQEQAASGKPWQVLLPEKEWAGADVLVPLLASTDPLVQRAAAVAVGRLEDPRTVPALMPIRDSFAIAQALRGFDPANDPALISRLQLTGRAAGMIRYSSEAQVAGVEQAAVHAAELTKNDTFHPGAYFDALATLEGLARLNRRVKAFDEPTIQVLTNSVSGIAANDLSAVARKHAFNALVNAGALDRDAEKTALNDQEWSIRRLAVLVLGGTGGGFDADARLAAIQAALTDPSPLVRFDALGAYVKRGVSVSGCGPIVDRITDDDTHVMLAAVDALGDLCKDDEQITTRLAAEAGVYPSTNWHRPAHAFVALAKRAPDRAAMSMPAFDTHPNWWVRMYAARAAAAMNDAIELDKLSGDVNDNVREATLVPLRRVKHFDADPAIAATLNSSDVQLLRSAALLLKESPHTASLFRPLMTALMRLTTDGRETSRDGRLALLDAIEVHIQQTEWTELRPLLKDFDPKVAARAAALMTKLTGKEAAADPQPYHRGWPAEFNHTRDTCVTVEMSSGGKFVLEMDWSAPITVDRFLRLAVKDHYYDGLTFHRVEPNFVIQGGSPGANEYAGNKEYMRDEINAAASNARGTVGLSTRGRNTADGQFFINLVDNPRLDLGYTIFASVRDADMAAVIDKIEQGAEIRAMSLGCPRK